jgi:2-amino-4-hydroxy-6-hydroxymethyldihydropteridine diphosphokinase
MTPGMTQDSKSVSKRGPLQGPTLDLPAWACVTAKRSEHIQRVTALLNAWAAAMRLPPADARKFVDAGVLHDALRDASEAELRRIAGDSESPVGLLHGPAAARMLENDGEKRTDLLDAIRFHTVGNAHWGIVGRALYMADFLEPGRKFMKQDRYFLALQVPNSFDAVFRQVVRMRLEWTVREGNNIFPETVALWNSLQ